MNHGTKPGRVEHVKLQLKAFESGVIAAEHPQPQSDGSPEA